MKDRPAQKRKYVNERPCMSNVPTAIMVGVEATTAVAPNRRKRRIFDKKLMILDAFGFYEQEKPLCM